MCSEKDTQVNGVMLRHLRAMLQDVDNYGWRVVREFHGAWLQLLEQGRATWLDEGERTQLRCRLVWSKPSLLLRNSAAPPSQTSSAGPQHPPAHQNQGRYNRFNPYNAKPDDRACVAYNMGSCQTPAAHPAELHVCAYCLRVANMLFRHMEGTCNRKAGAKNGAGEV